MNRKSLLTFGLFISLILPVVAQKDYAITLKGDTLTGKLKMSSIDNEDWLQITKDGKKINYKPFQIRRFHMDGTHFQTIKHGNTLRFMKVVRSGYLNLLAYSVSGQNTWDGLYLEKKDGTGMEVPNISFKKILSKYLSECPGVQDQITNGDLVKRDIERIVEIYNSCIQAKTDAVVKPLEVVVLINEKTEALQQLIKKVENENFLTKKDALEILGDIKGRVSKGEVVPNYLINGLKSYLEDTPDLSKEAESVIALLKK